MLDIRKLKIGDKVICINDKNNINLKINKVYTIEDFHYDYMKNRYYIVLKGYYGEFYIERFIFDIKYERNKKLKKIYEQENIKSNSTTT